MPDLPTVLLVEDHPLLLIGLKISLENIHCCKIVGEAGNGEDAVRDAHRLQPDIILMDVGLPGIDGVEATWRIKHHLPRTRVIMFTSHTAADEVSAALGAGADAYCSKDAPIEEIKKAIDAVMLGQVWIDPLIADVIVQSNDERINTGNCLSPSEFELLNLIKEGINASEIADRLKVTNEQVGSLMHKILNQFVKQSPVENPRLNAESSSHKWLTAHVNDLHEGKTFAEKYALLDLIGSGGLGTVYKAKHLYMDREVALKLLHPEFATDRLALRNFQKEAQAVALLRHENIVGVHDFGMSENHEPYLVMEYIDGISLMALLAEEKVLSQDRVVRLCLQVCAGLAEAHKQGIVHCDLKPSNILIQKPGLEEVIKLVDFGLAQVVPREPTASPEVTAKFFVCGTPLYMSPEQCLGQTLDARSDIYSLGCIMYEALSGSNPFASVTPIEIFAKQIKEVPQPMGSMNGAGKISEGVENCVLQMLEKDPSKRPQSAQEVLNLLSCADKEPYPVY